MVNNFDSFRDRFREEAFDHISDLERALFELDGDTSQTGLVEDVFRALHSLKGGGGMFGFEKLSAFTHDLETVYDQIRKGKLLISQRLLSITLRSVDLLRKLLLEEDANLPEVDKSYASIELELQSLLNSGADLSSPYGDTDNLQNGQSNVESGVCTFFIQLIPDKDVLSSGSNLFYVTDELASLGSIRLIPRLGRIPCLDGLIPCDCYTSWDIVLVTSKSEDQVKDVFIFIEDSSKIETALLSKTDLLKNEAFVQELDNLIEADTPFSAELLRGLVENYHTEETLAVASRKRGGGSASRPAQGSSLRVSSEKVDDLLDLVGELVLSQARLGLISERNNIPDLDLVSSAIQKLSVQLRDCTYSISLVPVSTLTMRLKRLIRDLSGSLGKRVEFLLEGEDTELDKSTMESITDPLMHIVRNCIDHGIENSAERAQAGKSEVAKIFFRAFYSGTNVIIEVEDDGRGLDVTSIKEKAVKRGLVKSDSHLSDQEVFDLLFLPGFSTRETVSEVSGRGVGLDVVKNNIAAVRGEVKIASTLGQRTRISLQLPMVLSIIDGLLITVGHSKFVIPLALSTGIFSIKREELLCLANGNVVLEGNIYPLVNLRAFFSIGGDLPEVLQAVLIPFKGERVLIAADRVIGKIQAVLKPMGKLHQQNRFLSAATILADGSIALVLDVNSIILDNS